MQLQVNTGNLHLLLVCWETNQTSFANHFGSEPFTAHSLQKWSCNNAKGTCNGFCRVPTLTNHLIYLRAGLACLGINHRNSQNCSWAGFHLPPAKTGRFIQLQAWKSTVVFALCLCSPITFSSLAVSLLLENQSAVKYILKQLLKINSSQKQWFLFQDFVWCIWRAPFLWVVKKHANLGFPTGTF